jgi:Dockerin type I domain
MSGGQINIVGTASNANTGTFTLGNSNNATNFGFGTMNMSGGTLNMGEGTMIVGFTRGYGTFSQSGGVVSVAADRPIVLGGAGAGTQTGGTGYYSLSGTGMLTAGSINYGRGGGDFFSTGSNTFSMQGGTLSVGSIGIAYTSTDNYVETFSFTGGTATIGTMELALTQQGGTLSPGAGGTVNGGASAAIMHLLDNSQFGTNGGKGTARPNAGQANYVQSAGAHLLLDIAGPGTAAASDPETNYDRLQVEDNAATSSSGTPTFATLNGEIDLRVPTSTATYNPSTSDAFYVVTADAITDNSKLVLTHDSPGYIFSKSTVSATISTGIFPANNPIPLPTTTSGQAILVSFVGHARPGDDTRDQTIDSSDFSVLAAHYGQVTSANYTIGWGDGDFNGDGTVNALDFNALATNYGKGGTVENPIGAALPDSAMSLGSVVPEPVSATLLLAIGGIGLMGRNRRRKM